VTCAEGRYDGSLRTTLVGLIALLNGSIMGLAAAIIWRRSVLGGYVANPLDDNLFTLTCDHCGEETQARVRVLRQSQTVACQFRPESEHNPKAVGH